MSFLRRRIITAALVANALRPLPGYRGGIASFVPGWMTTELAPHLFAVTAADTAAHAVWGGVPRPQPGRPGTRRRRASSASACCSSRRATHARTPRRRWPTGLGADYLDQLDPQPSPADLAVPWRRLVYPFRVRDLAVRVERDIAYAPEHGRRGLLDVYRPADGDLSGAPGARAGPRRRLDDRLQGRSRACR